MAYPQWAGKVLDADRVRTKAGLYNVQWAGANGNGGASAGPANDIAFAAAKVAADLTGRGLYMPLGDYYYSLPLVFTRSGMTVVGDVGTELHFTGVGIAITFDGGAVVGSLYGCVCSNLIIVGSVAATMTIGVYGRAMHDSVIDNVRVENASLNAYRQEFGLGNVVNILCSRNIRNFVVIPVHGVHLTRRGVGEHSTTTVLWNPIIEGLYPAGSVGIVFDYADLCSVDGGTSEGNDFGIELTANGGQHRVVDLWMEANTAADIVCASFWCEFVNCKSTLLARFTAPSYSNTLRRGSYQDITILTGALGIDLDRTAYNGVITDGGSGTKKIIWHTPDPVWTTGSPLVTAAIAANTNNYAPSGGTNCGTWRISATALFNITGISAVGIGADFELRLVNIGVNAITLTDDDVLSNAGNRMLLTAAIILPQDAGVILRYDDISARWRCVGMS